MKTIKSMKKWAIAVLTLLAIFACTKNTTAPDATAAISLEPQTLNLVMGTYATVAISGGTAPYTVTSENPGVATASAEGRALTVNAINKGTSTITVSGTDGTSATIAVTVTEQPAELISLNELREHASGESVTLSSAIKIEGVIISDADSKNIEENIAVLQSTNSMGGIVLQFTDAHTLKLYDNVEVEVSELTLARINGEWRVTGIPISNATKTAGQATITPRQTDVADVISNKAEWNGTLVTLPAGAISGNGAILDYTDASGTVQTRILTGADFTLPAAAGSLSGIVRIQGDQVRVDIRRIGDVTEAEEDMSAYFITKWNIGSENNLVLRATGNYEGIWEKADDRTINGTFTIVAGASETARTIDFGRSGEFIVKIKATNEEEAFNFALGTSASANHPEALKLLEVQQWGTNTWPTATLMFKAASNMDVTATDKPDMSKSVALSYMFDGCTNLKGTTANFSDWDVSNVTSFALMFRGATNFNSPLNNWNTSKSTNYTQMFQNATAFNQPLNSWIISTVTSSNMLLMFSGASSFNQPLDNWNTSQITNMALMFQNAVAFNQSLGNWDLRSIAAQTGSSSISLRNMLSGSGLNVANYNATLIGWANNSNTPNRTIELIATGLKYSTAATAARATLISKGWIITGDAAE